MQNRTVKIRKLCLEITKRLPRRLDHMQIIRSIKRHRIHIIDHTPERIIPVNIIIRPLIRMMKMKGDLIRILRADERRHMIDILHNLNRTLKYIRIDFLEQIRLERLLIRISYFISRVNISHCNHMVRIQLAGKPELLSDNLQCFKHIISSLGGRVAFPYLPYMKSIHFRIMLSHEAMIRNHSFL